MRNQFDLTAENLKELVKRYRIVHTGKEKNSRRMQSAAGIGKKCFPFMG